LLLSKDYLLIGAIAFNLKRSLKNFTIVR